VLQVRTPQKNEAAAIKLAAKTNRVKERILKIGLGHAVTIVRRDGQEFHGRIERIEDAFVVLYEVDLLVYALTCLRNDALVGFNENREPSQYRYHSDPFEPRVAIAHLESRPIQGRSLIKARRVLRLG
jgi:hypothetical protein